MGVVGEEELVDFIVSDSDEDEPDVVTVDCVCGRNWELGEMIKCRNPL